MSAPLDLANRFASLDDEEHGDKAKKHKPMPTTHGQASGASKKDNSRSAKKNEAHAAEVATFNKEHPQASNDRRGPRVQDRFHSRRGRGGAGSGGAPANATGGFRGREYISDNNERTFDRRGANTKHRGGLHKGGALLGKETDPELSQPLADSVDGEVSADSNTAASASETDGKVEAEFKPIDAEEEAEAKKKTYEEYLEELRKKAPEDDLKKQVREAQNDEKQWKKVVALQKKDEAVKLGKDDVQDGHKDDDADKKNKANNANKKEKKVFSLDEFVGGSGSSSASPNSSARGSNRGGYRGGRGGKFATTGSGVDVHNNEEFPALGAK